MAISGIDDLNNRHLVDLTAGAPPLDDNSGFNKGAIWILFMDEPEIRTRCERSSLPRFLGIGNCQ